MNSPGIHLLNPGAKLKRIYALVEALEVENGEDAPEQRALQVMEALWDRGVVLVEADKHVLLQITAIIAVAVAGMIAGAIWL